MQLELTEYATLFAIVVAVAVASLIHWASLRKRGKIGNHAPSYAARANVALLRPPRALYPWVKPRGIMNLRSLPDDCNGLFLDIDSNYLVQLELKKVLIRKRSST